MNIIDELFALQDVAYGDFQSKLTPGIPRELFIGVRVPQIRKLAKKIKNEPECVAFLDELPHKYYEENMLHSVLVSEIKDYDECIARIDIFLPYVDNWAVCDTISPKVFKRNKTDLIDKIKGWVSSERTYTCRFGVDMLMSFFLDDDFETEYLEIPASVRSEEYYVRMMVAWYFATALAKQWDAAIKYIEDKKLDDWTHNKSIQKARESYRITPKQKEYLKTLKKL